jgi:hypothetical protein
MTFNPDDANSRSVSGKRAIEKITSGDAEERERPAVPSSTCVTVCPL